MQRTSGTDKLRLVPREKKKADEGVAEANRFGEGGEDHIGRGELMSCRIEWNLSQGLWLPAEALLQRQLWRLGGQHGDPPPHRSQFFHAIS